MSNINRLIKISLTSSALVYFLDHYTRKYATSSLNYLPPSYYRNLTFALCADLPNVLTGLILYGIAYNSLCILSAMSHHLVGISRDDAHEEGEI